MDGKTLGMDGTMEMNRREFVNLATGSVATYLLGATVPTVGNSGPPTQYGSSSV